MTNSHPQAAVSVFATFWGLNPPPSGQVEMSAAILLFSIHVFLSIALLVQSCGNSTHQKGACFLPLLEFGATAPTELHAGHCFSAFLTLNSSRRMQGTPAIPTKLVVLSVLASTTQANNHCLDDSAR